MSDLRLITILPPQPVQGVQQQPQVAGNQSQQTGLAGYQAGSVLSGFIINRDSSGNPILRTDSGDIIFSSNFFLKIGSEITIRIEHIAGNNSAHILSVNGQPPEIAILQSGLSQEPEVIVSENLLPARQSTTKTENVSNFAPVYTTTPTVTITGSIISPAASQPPTAPDILAKNAANPTPPQQPQLLPSGSQLSLKIVNISFPQSASQPPTTTSSETIPQQNVTVSPSPTPTSSYSVYTRAVTTPPSAYPAPENLPSAPTAIQTSTTQHNEVITPPITTAQTTSNSSTPLPSNTPPQAGQQITGTVISTQPNGESIIQTEIGVIRLQTPINLPVDSHVTFEIEKIQPPTILESTNNQQPITNNPLPPAPLTQLARTSGALSNIFSLLTNFGSGDALNFINKNIPTIGQSTGNATSPAEQPKHNILAPLLTFVSALRNSDFRTWLGHGNAKWLEDNGYENLLKKAEGEFLSVARQFADAPEKQWQSLFFPIAVDGELQQARLFVKRDRRQKEKNGKPINEEDTRFVLEIGLSQLGEMQMDGFVRRNNENVQFDLIIRSHVPLSQDIQKDILNIYNSMGELTGYQGNIVFQNVKDFPVNPMEDIVSDQHEGIVA